MILRWKDGETVVFGPLPRDENRFMQFLTKEKLNPVIISRPNHDSTSGMVVRVNREIYHDQLIERWHKFTGYDKILAAYLKRLGS